jgi:hypothetical protein
LEYEVHSKLGADEAVYIKEALRRERKGQGLYMENLNCLSYVALPI